MRRQATRQTSVDTMSRQPALDLSHPPFSVRWVNHFTSVLHNPPLQADGKVVLALEGGYTGPGVAESVLHCLRALLGEPCPR